MGTTGFGVVDSTGVSVAFGSIVSVLLGVATTDAPSLIPALSPALTSALTSLVPVGVGRGRTGFVVLDPPASDVSVGSSMGTIGFGVVGSTGVSVAFGSIISVLLGVATTDAPSLIPALNPTLTPTFTPLVPVVIGSGRTGFGVLDPPVGSICADAGWPEPVALDSAWFATEEPDTLS